MTHPRWRISVTQYPFEVSAKSLLNLLRDGKYHESRGIAKQKPFSEYVRIDPDEIKGFTDENGNPDQRGIRRYADKKRDTVSQQLAAMKLLGIAMQRNRTGGAAYALTPFGIDIVRGLALLQAGTKHDLSFEEMLQRLSTVSQESEESEESEN